VRVGRRYGNIIRRLQPGRTEGESQSSALLACSDRDQKTARHARRLWLHYGVFWSGAIAVGLLAVLYAWLIDFATACFAPASIVIHGSR
jgi:CHASE2 domain-containing sensor protein